MIFQNDKFFALETKHTTYAFRILETGQAEQLYYGPKITLGKDLSGLKALCEQHAYAPGNSICYDQGHLNFTLEDMCLEMSSYGKGDIREPFLEIVHGDGSRTSDFLYDHFEIHEGKTALKELPSALSGVDSQELCLFLTDKRGKMSLELRYVVYESCDCITRSAILTNNGEVPVTVNRLMSGQLDLPTDGWRLTSFHGAWTREMTREDRMLLPGKYVGGSFTGTSSNRCNPFFMVSRPETTEANGLVYGFNLIYSGNHMECCEVNAYGKTRIVQGMNPTGFAWSLAPGQQLEAPEMVFTVSGKGFNGLSQHMHAFVRNNIVRGSWAKKQRPILLNSWEAAYFDINEHKLLELAKAGKKAGIELFVMDDGWFGNRRDDQRSLGDWTPNLKKLPEGVFGICEKIRNLGLLFGIWVEPEMVNTDSDLYREHPDWCLQIPGADHSEGRNQRILDFCNPGVQEYIIRAMSEVFASADISYVKWDMNRIMSDVYSPYLAKEKQGETAHRYVLGLYHVMETLVKRFPDILFEGCASGGNRFDLGILCYFPQIWGSDNTDAICRAEIQTGYSYGYPLETVGAHVSGCPNHQTLRKTPLETRFAVAAFGSLGYECNFVDMKKEDLDAVKAQITLYKKLRPVMQFGSFYRGRTFKDDDGNICEWTVVSRNRTKAVGMLLQKQVSPNTQFQYYKAQGLKKDKVYHFTNRKLKYNVKEFGDLVNTVAPIHVKQDSLVHNAIAAAVRMDGEIEDYYVYGDVLMNAGVKLKQGFGGTGYNDQVRHFPDYAARMYFME